jgi:hypothetical protein
LIYEDNTNTLIQKQKKTYNEKNMLCSFVGTLTHYVRHHIVNRLQNNKNFHLFIKHSWSANVEENHQINFIENTIHSKFALAPRGYGRSSFRFFEIFKLGTIPIYVWDDIEWLPYKDVIDYSKICISIHITELNKLEDILLNIDEIKYNEMIENYNKISYMFELDYMCEYIYNNNIFI